MSDKNNLVYREQLDDNVIEMLSEDIGSNYSLRTENTRTIVSALNEVLGKDIIMNVIGEPLLTTDTFAEMGGKIKELSNAFRAKLLGLGVSVSSVDKMAVMIEKMSEIDLGVDADELLQTYIDSLKQVLIENGVEVNGNETLAELIVKVDTTLIEKDVVIENLNNKNEENENSELQLYTLLKNVGYNVSDDNSISDMCNILENTSLSPINVKYIACGENNTFVIKEDGSLWACGSNSSGRLGIGSTDTTSHPRFIKIINNGVKQVSCGPNHTMVLKEDGSLWACGNNNHGQMGTNETSYSFIQVTTNVNNDVKFVECGYYCTFIIKNDGSLWACGYNSSGQLGLEVDDDVYVFTQVTTDVKQVACGGCRSVFIIKNDGSLWACGDNNYGQLGLGDETDRTTFTQVTTNINNDVKYVTCGGYVYNSNDRGLAFIIKNDGSLWACGYNVNGCLGIGSDAKVFTQVTTNINNDVKEVCCGPRNTFIIKNDGSLWACGYNNYGWLGLDDVDQREVFTQVTTNINNDVRLVACGRYTSNTSHTIILKDDSCIWACGYNNAGQLGLETTEETHIFNRLFGFKL